MKLSMRVPRNFMHEGAASNDPKPQESASGSVAPDLESNGNKASNAQPTGSTSTCCGAACCFPVNWYLFNTSQRLRSFCWITAWVHFLVMCVYAVLAIAQDVNEITIPRLKTPITKNIGVWTNATEKSYIDTSYLQKRLELNECPLAEAVSAKDSAYDVQQFVLDAKGQIDTRVLIIVFHLLSFLFQSFTALGDQYYDELEQGRTNLSHFLEYSITASLMLIAMAAQFGITDVFLIISIAANCTGCMLFGLMAEFLFYQDSEFRLFTSVYHKDGTAKQKDSTEKQGARFKGHWLAHFAGWFMLGIALVCACSNLISIQTCAASKDAKPPDFVQWIVGTEIFFFSCFGFVQLASFLTRENVIDQDTERAKQQRQSNKEIAQTTEFFYILLSILSKLSLGLIIMAGNYTNK